MDTTALSIHGLEKRYGRQTIFTSLNLEINAGSCVGLIGVNGAGKSTLLKCLLDFCAIDAGKIAIFGVPHTQTKARARLAFLPEHFLPPYFARGHEFLSFMATLYGHKISKDEIESILDILDLEPAALNKPVRQLSKGMAQKLGLAAIFLSQKDLLILDEPMSGLDPKARLLLLKQLANLKQQGKTVFFSTHLLADVKEICDGIAVLHHGDIRFSGTLESCYTLCNTRDLEQAYLMLVNSP
jgi:ABC-type multidrug transport system ATPase subunit